MAEKKRHGATRTNPQPVGVPSPELEAHLRQQYAELAYIAGGLAHEIKNPLSTIRLNLDLLAEDLDPDNPAHRRMLRKLELVQRECERLEGIVEEFLQFARASELHREACDLNALVQDLVEFLGPTMAEHRIEVAFYPRSDLPLVRVDRDLLKQALLNLLLNARDAMPEGGQIVIATQPGDGDVQVTVIDTGVGMPREILEKIFHPFFSTRRHGTGLGLPTVRKIVEAHGGKVTVESEPGKGSKFTIHLPVGERG